MSKGFISRGLGFVRGFVLRARIQINRQTGVPEQPESYLGVN
jgi:hypothetical protein